MPKECSTESWNSCTLVASRWVLVLVVLLTACDSEQPASEFEIDLTVSELMHVVVEPAAEKLWGSAGYIITMEGTEDLAPTTDEGWLEVIHAASVLMESGNLLMLPERRIDEPDWQEFSIALSKAAKKAQSAATDQDADALFDAGGVIYNVCRACHQQYWKDQPIRPSEA